MVSNCSKIVFKTCEPLIIKGKSLLSTLQTGNPQIIFTRLVSESRNFKLNMGRKVKNKTSGGDKSDSRQQVHKIPSSINLVVVGTGGPGTSKCLLLTTEYSRYMFNCGEGSQRLTVMNKCLKSSAFAKISGVENIFITHKNWENTGGLLGIAMLVEGQKNPEIKNYLSRQTQKAGGSEATNSRETLPELNLYGPDGIEKITMMARKFAQRSNINIVKKEGAYEDFAVKITPVVLLKKTCQVPTAINCEPLEASVNASEAALSYTDQEQTYAYICTAKPEVPKINVEKCVDAGITMGPMVGELQRGKSVTLPDGTVIRPEQVTDVPENSYDSFLVVECPSEDYINSLQDSDQLNDYQGENRKDKLAIVVHMTPARILNSPVYKQWMLGFGKDTDHLVMNDEASPADLSRVRTHQAQLNVVNSDVFPLLPRISCNPTGDTLQTNPERESVREACSGLVYTLRGKNLRFHVETDEIDEETLQKNLLEIPEVKEELDNLTGKVQNGESQYPKIVFLGTGSSEPNRIRAQSCIAVDLSEDCLILLDCGEDSFGQFFRFFGQDEASRALLKLKAIFISHMHGDHHLGLLTLLKERRKVFERHDVPFEQVLLMAPIQMKRWLKFYHCEVEQIFHLFRFHKHQKELKEFEDKLMLDRATDEDINNILGFTEYRAVEVIHARNSYGVTFTHRSGFKLVYSGDTRPCDLLVEAGQDCDLLIHEATHEDDLLPHAKASKHSTFSEAMDVGKRMKAKHVILTHFSQRYPHMVPFFGMSVPSNVGIAFDNMQVTQESLPLLQSFISPLTQIFADKLTRLEIKSLKRNREKANLDEF